MARPGHHLEGYESWGDYEPSSKVVAFFAEIATIALTFFCCKAVWDFFIPYRSLLLPTRLWYVRYYGFMDPERVPPDFHADDGDVWVMLEDCEIDPWDWMEDPGVDYISVLMSSNADYLPESDSLFPAPEELRVMQGRRPYIDIDPLDLKDQSKPFMNPNLWINLNKPGDILIIQSPWDIPEDF